MAEIFLGNIKGEKGDTGNGLTIKDYYSTFEELTSAIPNPSAGDAYGVGDEIPYDIYIYSTRKGWVNNGALQPDINEQAPNYAESTILESLTSGEKISVAFGKIKKAIKDLISHIADTTKHITSTERTAWNGKAPSGHGLGTTATSDAPTTYKNFMHKGCGFYAPGVVEESPHGTEKWTGMIQLVRSKAEDNETGSQLAFYDFEPTKPRMWLRTILTGTVGNWVEMLHTGNIEGYGILRMETKPYTGNGLYGFENARTFTFSFTPKMLYISGYGRAGGNYTLTVPYGFPFAHVVVHTENGFATMNCEFRYSGNTVTVYNSTSATNGFNTDGKDYTITAVG